MKIKEKTIYNKICEACKKKCKQKENIKIIYCPNYEKKEK